MGGLHRFVALLTLLFPVMAAGTSLPSPVLDRVHARHALQCGVIKEEEDYSRSEDHGNRAAFDLDLCRAVAVAVLGPAARVLIRTYPDEPFALKALRAGEVDLVATASLTLRNTAAGVQFSAPVLLDGQGMLVHAGTAAQQPQDLAGKCVCFLTGSAAEDGLHRFAEAHGITYIWYPFSEAGEMEAALFTGNCDALTGDLTQLANIRAIDPRRAASFVLLPQTLRDEPLAMATAPGDPRFSAMVFWTVELLLEAEAVGVSKPTVAAFPQKADTLLPGQRFGASAELGLPPRWGAAVVGAVGNYGEIFARDLGAGSPLQLPRGPNRLTTAGGALEALPLNDR